MNKSQNLIRIIFMAAVIVLLIASCDSGSDNLSDTNDITWTAAADGMINTVTSTKITFTFNENISNLDSGHITITNGTGIVTKGALTGSGKEWTIAITVTQQGKVSVHIDKETIVVGPKNVDVYKASGGDGNGGGGDDTGGGKDSGSNTSHKALEFINIDESLDGCYLWALVSPSNDDTDGEASEIAQGNPGPVQIYDSIYTNYKLYNGTTPWTGSGSYYIWLRIYEDWEAVDTGMYDRYCTAVKISIDKPLTTLSMGFDFIPVD